MSAPLQSLRIEQDALVLSPADGEHRRFEVCYAALGCTPQNQLAADLGADRDESGALRVNSQHETSIPRLYAAGDVVRGLNQIVVAAAEAAIAATDIHNRLRAERSSAMQPGGTACK